MTRKVFHFWIISIFKLVLLTNYMLDFFCQGVNRQVFTYRGISDYKVLDIVPSVEKSGSSQIPKKAISYDILPTFMLILNQSNWQFFASRSRSKASYFWADYSNSKINCSSHWNPNIPIHFDFQFHRFHDFLHQCLNRHAFNCREISDWKVYKIARCVGILTARKNQQGLSVSTFSSISKLI